MNRIVLIVLMACLLAGCAAKLTMDQSGMIGPDGKYITVMSGTTRDRFGTELQTQTWFSDDGKVLVAYQGYGAGIGTTAMTGAVAGLEQAGGLIGAGALIRPTNISGGNSSSTSASKSKAKTNQAQNQGQNQGQTQAQNQTQALNNTNVNTALGGAGGAGGSVVNSGNNVGVATISGGAGGIGNISSQGNSVVNTGQGMINTGNNATVTGPLTQF